MWRTSSSSTPGSSLCDVYDALISPRVYRDRLDATGTIALLREQTGQAFDHRCVSALELVLARECAEELAVAV